MDNNILKVVAGLSLLAFVGFLAYRNKEMFKSDVKPEAGISKTFIVLIVAVPIILALLYSMKVENRGGMEPSNGSYQNLDNTPVQQDYDSGVKEY